VTVISDQMLALHEGAAVDAAVERVREKLANVRNVVVNTNDEIQLLVDAGNLNNLPAELKAALSDAWTVTKAAETALDDGGIAEALDWAVEVEPEPD